MPRVQWAGRCPSATARSTVRGTQGCLDLECDPLMHIIEGEPQTTTEPVYHHRTWGTPLLTEQASKVFISGGSSLSHAT